MYKYYKQPTSVVINTNYDSTRHTKASSDFAAQDSGRRLARALIEGNIIAQLYKRQLQVATFELCSSDTFAPAI